MTDKCLPTLLATSAKSAFRLRCFSAAWSAECGGTVRHGSDRPGLILLSAIGPDTATKAVRAILYQPDVQVEFALELDGTTERLGRACYDGKPVVYQAAVAKLAHGAVHLVAIAKVAGVMPCLSDDHLWAEMSGPRYTTPLLRSWTGWLKRAMIESGGIVMAEGHNSQAGILTTTPEELDEMVSSGVRSGHLKMRQP